MGDFEVSPAPAPWHAISRITTRTRAHCDVRTLDTHSTEKIDLSDVLQLKNRQGIWFRPKRISSRPANHINSGHTGLTWHWLSVESVTASVQPFEWFFCGAAATHSNWLHFSLAGLIFIIYSMAKNFVNEKTNRLQNLFAAKSSILNWMVRIRTVH